MVAPRRSIGAAVTAALLVVLAGCGQSAPSDEAVGYKDATRPLDTRPFEMEGLPKEGTATTLPDGYFEQDEDPFATSTTTSTTQPPVTTTTIAPAPLIPQGDAAKLCGFTDMVQSMQRLGEETPAQTEAIMNQLPAALERYRTAGPASTRDDLASIRRTVESLRDVLRMAKWDANASAFTERIQAIGKDPSSSDQFVVRLNRVAQEEAMRCG